MILKAKISRRQAHLQWPEDQDLRRIFPCFAGSASKYVVAAIDLKDYLQELKLFLDRKHIAVFDRRMHRQYNRLLMIVTLKCRAYWL